MTGINWTVEIQMIQKKTRTLYIKKRLQHFNLVQIYSNGHYALKKKKFTEKKIDYFGYCRLKQIHFSSILNYK